MSKKQPIDLIDDRLLNILNRVFMDGGAAYREEGLPWPGTVTDWELTLTKEGWKFHKDNLKSALKKLIVEARIEEVGQIPNPAIIAIDGKRREPMLKYKTDRINSLKEGRE